MKNLQSTRPLWNPDFSVRVKEIDKQHKMFFAILEEIYSLLDSEKTQKEILTVLSKLGGYAHYHLATEEEYFLKFNYEGRENHVLAHDAFREKIKKMIEQCRLGKQDVLRKTADFANEWLIQHIHNSDKEYTECFHQHGLY